MINKIATMVLPQFLLGPNPTGTIPPLAGVPPRNIPEQPLSGDINSVMPMLQQQAQQAKIMQKKQRKMSKKAEYIYNKYAGLVEPIEFKNAISPLKKNPQQVIVGEQIQARNLKSTEKADKRMHDLM